MSVERRRWFPPKGRWFRLALVVVCPLVSLPVLVNLGLALPWPRQWISNKISQRVGLTAGFGSVSWWPWQGLRIRELSVEQPAGLGAAGSPLAKIDRIDIDPRWSSVLRGGRGLESVRLHGGEVVVAVGMLPSLIGAPASPVQAPAVALAEPGGNDPPPAVVPEERRDPAPVAVPDAPELPAIPPARDARPPMVVELENLDFRLVSSGLPEDLACVRGISARLPLQGPDADGRLSFGSLSVGGKLVAEEVAAALQWRAPELRCGGSELVIAGVRARTTARFVRAPGWPFVIEISAVKQDAGEIPLPVAGGAAVKEFAAGFRAGGLIRHPLTWQALLAAESGAIELTGGDTAFLRSTVVAALQGGVVFCPDARLVGERLSFLGNGAVSATGATGALRVVMPPDIARTWTSRLEALAPEARTVFTDLGTPDRSALDLRWVSYEGRSGVSLGPGGTFVHATDAFRLLEAWFRSLEN